MKFDRQDTSRYLLQSCSSSTNDVAGLDESAVQDIHYRNDPTPTSRALSLCHIGQYQRHMAPSLAVLDQWITACFLQMPVSGRAAWDWIQQMRRHHDLHAFFSDWRIARFEMLARDTDIAAGRIGVGCRSTLASRARSGGARRHCAWCLEGTDMLSYASSSTDLISTVDDSGGEKPGNGRRRAAMALSERHGLYHTVKT